MVTGATNLGLDLGRVNPASQQLGAFTWDIYTFEYQGLVLDLALAAGDGMTYMVLLASKPGDHPALYEQVFLPAVEALAPLQE